VPPGFALAYGLNFECALGLKFGFLRYGRAHQIRAFALWPSLHKHTHANIQLIDMEITRKGATGLASCDGVMGGLDKGP
jgi:hypothetical protein